MHLSAGGVLLALGLVWWPVPSAIGQPERRIAEQLAPVLPRNSRLIDVTVGPSVSKATGSRVLGLLVNRDEDVLSCAWTIEGQIAHTVGCRKRGQALTRSGRLGLEEYIPKGEVPFSERRVTRDAGVWHVVLSWKLDKRYGRGAEFWVRMLRDTSAGVKQVLEQQGDLFLEGFLVEDINGDGVEEVVVSGRGETGVSGWMSIWSLKGDQAEKIGFTTERGFNPSMDKVVPYEISTHESVNRESRRETTTYYYRWNQERRRYVLRTKVVEECNYIAKPGPSKSEVR